MSAFRCQRLIEARRINIVIIIIVVVGGGTFHFFLSRRVCVFVRACVGVIG